MANGKTRSVPVIAALFAFLIAMPGLAQDKTAYISTLDWPPYTGGDLPGGGATSEVVRQAFEKAGYQTDVAYRPWKRAIDMAKEGKEGVVAYFPGYHCRHQDGFIASEIIGNGPLGFAEHADAPIIWDTLDSIGDQQLKIGTVLGYANTDEFDQKVGTGWILAVPSNDDLTNLKKLTRQRIDAAVIDKFVLEYLKATEPSLKSSRDALVFNSKPLEEKTLYLCFRDDEVGRAMLSEFNSGLAQVDVDAIAEDYFATAFSQ
ncbi:substrate-binding periplasmic protein [Marimonas sp. MJW-29]|uniref:Substrate-binding periplasmic protein n=1 Tax=Sulfitobacter sediminis TaxID=3234186 RepID=A0ABV3RS41_9RHOB